MAMNGNPLVDHLDLWTSALLNKSTAGRGSNGKQEAYGIKKLRELILELAVRGKLVPQNPEDEPAYKLLRKIDSEKLRLVQDGKIKKPKAVSDVVDDETLCKLPSGWAWARLDHLAPMSLFDGDWIETDDQDPNGSVRLIQLADVGVDEFRDVSERFINDQTFEKLSCTELFKGDILIARLPSPIGRACIFPGLLQRAITAVDVAILRPFDFAVDRYLVHAINSALFRNQVEEFGKGATRFRISTGNLKAILLPVPPKAEQHRIVAKVDELMALCNRLEQQQAGSQEAHQTLVETLLGALTQIPARPEPVEGRPSTARSFDCSPVSPLRTNGSGQSEFEEAWTRIADHFDTLFTTEHSIDQLKQTILQLAVMGKLVPQDPNDEPATKLCESDEHLLAQAQLDIPHGWGWCTLNKLAEINGGFAFKSTAYNDEGMRVVRISDFDEFGFNDHKIVRHPFMSELSRFTLEQSNILMAMTGGTVGKSYLVKSLPEPMVVNQRVATIKVSAFADPCYIDIVIRSEMTQDVIRKAKNSTNDNISMTDIKGFSIPLPPLAEQHRIVAKVDELMALCDTLKTRLKAAQAIQIHLADAIVEQAVA